jgi:hypothetical protein
MDATASPLPPVSPCVRNCCLDEQQVCLGCGRTLQEILDWHAADAEQRLGILERADARIRARRTRGGTGFPPLAGG